MSVLVELKQLPQGGSKAKGRHNKIAGLFLAPWLIGLVAITGIPLIVSLGLSFTDYPLLKGPTFNGLDNYIRMFSDARFMKSLQVTITYVVISTPLQLALALAIAMLLNRGMRGLSFYRSVFYLPSLMGSSVAIAMLWRQLFGSSGLVSTALARFGIVDPSHSWIADPHTALWSIILLHVWTFGSPMIIFLAGLRQIPTMYYEAAAIDGAGKWTQFRRITMPLLSPIIFFNLVMQIIGAFQSFTQAFVVSNGTGGPVDSTLFYSLYVYQQGFVSFRMGYASALAWVLVLIVGASTAVLFWSSKYWVFYED
jgi:multiple sugar transport system permease protein